MAKKMTENMEPFVGFKQASLGSGITVSFLRKLKDQKKVRYYKIGGRVYFRMSELNQDLAKYKVPACV